MKIEELREIINNPNYDGYEICIMQNKPTDHYIPAVIKGYDFICTSLIVDDPINTIILLGQTLTCDFNKGVE